MARSNEPVSACKITVIIIIIVSAIDHFSLKTSVCMLSLIRVKIFFCDNFWDTSLIYNNIHEKITRF